VILASWVASRNGWSGPINSLLDLDPINTELAGSISASAKMEVARKIRSSCHTRATTEGIRMTTTAVACQEIPVSWQTEVSLTESGQAWRRRAQAGRPCAAPRGNHWRPSPAARGAQRGSHGNARGATAAGRPGSSTTRGCQDDGAPAPPGNQEAAATPAGVTNA
jgi:hypothetical protein